MANLLQRALQQYMGDNHLTHEQLARLAKVERATISKVLSGKKKRFSPEAGSRISKATKGKISLEVALGLEPRTAA